VLTQAEAADSAEALEKACREFHARPFDLQVAPLWRAELIELGPGDFALALCLHHMITDGWSMGLMARELAERYGRHVRGEPRLELDPTARFPDLARVEREQLRGPELERLVALWRKTLAGAPPTVELPYDRPLPALATHAGCTLHGQLSRTTTAAIQTLASDCNATPYQVLLALFASFLARLAQTRDLVIGTSYAGRDQRAARDVIGAFVGTLPLRLRFEEEPTLTSAIHEVRRVLRDATASAALPFEKLVGELGGERDPRRTPLFNVFFELAMRPKMPTWYDLEVEELEVDLGEAPFELALTVDAQGARFATRLQYKTDLFDAATIAELWSSFELFAEAASGHPDEPLTHAPLVPAARVAERLRPAAPSAPFVPLHETLAASAAEHANRIALEDKGRTWTYAELDHEANLLAGALRAATPAAPENALIGVALERSAETVLAALAIWKAGYAYVPLDPAEPEARRTKIVATLAPALVVTRGATTVAPAPHFDLENWRKRKPAPAIPAPCVRREDTAYVIFTSGSTGEPKGVAVPQRALANHIAWVRAAFDLEPDDRVLLRTPLGFDAAIWELVNPLAAGARLVIARRATAEDSHAVLQLARTKRITVVQSVPSILRAWLDEPNFEMLTSLRFLICAGEVLPHALADKVLACTKARLFNLYGPTEACIDATWQPVLGGEAHGGRSSVPIGRPIHGTGAMVLDRNLEPLPDGVTGELFLVGAGLAKGYLGRPDETARRFVELQLGGARVRAYRTGDRARRIAGGRARGAFEAMGRDDAQVKVRGQRIELGEIEASLAALPGVGQAAVLAHEDPSGNVSLHAFVSASQPLDLHSRLAEDLPRAMRPTTISTLEALPLSNSEKIDRRALAELIPATTKVATARPPRGATETWLATELAKLLDVPEVDVAADFFQIGGHSLLATRLLARARAYSGAELGLRDFLESPTLEALARTIDAAEHQSSSPTPIPYAGRDSPLPLSRAQERLWLQLQRGDEAGSYKMPGGLILRGALDVDALAVAARGLVERHESLRTRFRETSSGSHGPVELCIDPRAHVTLPLEPLATRAELMARLAEESRRVLDLERGPLFVLRLFQLGAREFALVFNLHHLLGDAWSLEILARELAALYAAARSSRPAELEALPIQYADFAAWERARAPRPIEPWIRKLTGAPALLAPLALPTDRPRPAHPSHRGAEVVLSLPAILAESLRARASASRVSLHNVLLTTFACFLARISGQDDLVLGAVLGNRPALETEGIIGFFVSALPVRLELGPCHDFAMALAHTTESMTFALEHADVGLDELIEELDRRDLLPPETRTTPLFQVGFDHAPRPEHALELAGLEVERIPFHSGTAKLDLNVLVEEDANGLTARIEFATDLFDATTVQRLARLWFDLAARLVTSPVEALESFPLGTPANREAWLAIGRGPAKLDGAASSLAQFEAQVALRATAVALVDGDRRLRFDELDRAASELAARLVTLETGGPIAVQLPRSPEQVAALFGIWRAGRAWIALDAEEPIARRRALVNKAHVAGLVTGTPGPDLGVPQLAPPAFDLPAPSFHATSPPAHSDAYLVATSGTTGTPKCIAIGHGALANHNTAAIAYYRFDATDVILHRIPLTFDAALLELITPLCAGARVVLVGVVEARQPDALLALAAAEGATILDGVASWLEALLTNPGYANLQPPRLLISGGEPLGPRLLDAWRRGPQVPPLINSYGPAEACIQATAWSVQRNESLPIPIGKPLAGMQVHVLDPAGRPLPPGVEGELVIAGAGLARGYVDAEPKDSARFRASHLDEVGRVYWTGDRAVRRADGVLFFRGRRDRELKLGGRRLDPGEVEAVLMRHRHVRGTAVTSPAGQRLVAHIEAARPVTRDDLEAFCRTALPSSLCPTEWRLHDELPRQPSGKLDLALLTAEPELGRLLDHDTEPGRTALEKTLVGLFAAALETQHIGRSSDYFLAGGHSLSAIRLVAEIRERTGRSLKLANFFKHTSPAALARHLEGPSTRGGNFAATWNCMRADAHFEIPGPVAPPRTGGAVLLTGATGFLGAFLLAELLEASDREVFCLVRARDAGEALVRLRDNLTRYGLAASPEAWHRVHGLAGDLARPRFGLEPEVWIARVADLGHVVHNGAAVDFFRDYGDLRGPNVEGARTALELAWRAGASLELVSTIGVVADPNTKECRDESTSLEAIASTGALDAGYEQTKWVAESLVESAAAAGLTARVFRPGRISASARRSPGAGNPGDFANRFLVGCLELGLAPALDGSGSAVFDVTPVDHTARAILALAGLSGEPAAPPGTWHILHPEPAPYRGFFDAARRAGHALDFVPVTAWLQAASAAPNEHLAPLLAMLHDLDEEEATRTLAPDAALASLSSARSHAALDARGLIAPRIDAAYFDAAARWLTSAAKPTSR
jgi:amino acid adenylation domain-containing protein/thioester reductase-like protein